MAKSHGARQQKRLAKKKAKQSTKRSIQLRRESNDPTIRLRAALEWPVVRALVADELWETGIGHLLIARQKSPGQMVLGVYLVDVYCLGVKNAFWRAGAQPDLVGIIHRIEEVGKVSATTPAAVAKIIKGAVDYAASFGFAPHPDYHHAAMLLEGIDPSTCPTEFTFGLDGKPFYMRGPNESLAEAEIIVRRIQEYGGDFMVAVGGDHMVRGLALDDGFDDLEPPDDDEFDEDDILDEDMRSLPSP